MRLLLLHIIITLLTCDPGQDIYARFGHTAVRVQDTETGMDLVFNYGLFSFSQPHFYARFIKGETYYQLGAQYSDGFYKEYAREGRRVHSQVLDLTEEQAMTIWEKLRINYQPQNREYLYNFVFDNCATRPLRLITETIEENELSDKQKEYKRLQAGVSTEGTPTTTPATYRERIETCVGKHSVEAFAIDLLLGPKADAVADSLFLPECLMNYMETTGLVKNSDIAPFPVRKTPFMDDIRVVLVLFTLLMAGLTYLDRKRGKLSWFVDLIIGIATVIVLAIVTYLTFFSLHPLVGFGWRLILIPAIWICSRLFYFMPSRS